jgi:formate dehydrogenase major subunit
VHDRATQGSVFIPMHFREAAANVLTSPAIDPIGKIPTFKFCAVRLTRLESGSAKSAG